jgi:hypothetical protein
LTTALTAVLLIALPGGDLRRQRFQPVRQVILAIS